MIRLATVFSGIGAIEHALNRMQLEHEIVFACDNGDVELDIKTTEDELDTMNVSLAFLINEIGNIRATATGANADYAEQLEKMLQGAQNAMQELENMLIPTVSILVIDLDVNSVFNSMKNIVEKQLEACSSSKRKKYKELLQGFKLNTISDNAKRYLIIKAILTLREDEIVIDNEDVSNFELTIGSNIKKIVKQGKDIKERINMLYDKIFYFETSDTLSKLPSYADRKKYVDGLYKGKEKSNKVKESYLANYKLDPKHFHWNVAFLDGAQYAGQVDLFVGGSPCQSFSLVGKQRGLEDTRGTLFYEYARLIKEIQPKVFIYENVKAILSNDDGKTWEKMKEVFASLGYKVFYTMNGKP